MKIIKEEFEELMKDHNKNLEEPKNAVTSLSPTYQQAIEDNERIEKKLGDDLKDMAKKGDEMKIDSPDTGTKVKNAYTEQITLDESLFEEYGAFKGELYLDQIADDLRRGDYYGEVDDIPWTLTINGRDCEDFESDWFLEYILDGISYAVQDGHLGYGGFQEHIIPSDFEDKPDEWLKAKADAELIFDLGDEDFADKDEIDFWYDWDIDFDVDAWEEKQDSYFDDEEEFSVEDESLQEATKKIEDLPDTIYELAYDRMFPAAVKNYKPTILLDNPISFDDSKIYMSDYVGFEDIGAVVQNEEEANFVKDLAKFVGAEYKFLPTEKIPGGVKGIGASIIHFKDEKEANTPTAEYLKKIGYEGAVRKDPNAYKKKDDDFEEKLTLDEEAKITIGIYDFEPWSGAVEYFNVIKDKDMLDELDAFIEEMYPEGISDVELNDLLWFEPEYVFEALGIDYEF